LGLLYEKITEYLGFLTSSDEYKVMALASYGKPVYLDDFHEIVQYHGEGQYTVQSFDPVERFGPRRQKGEPFEQKHYDLAHSLQAVLEETALKVAGWLQEKTGAVNLCLAGGVALNCVMNAYLRDCGTFDDIWVQPAAGDAGTALGAALWIDAQESQRRDRPYMMDHAFLGPGYSEEEIENFLRWSKLPYRRLENVVEEAADLLAQDKIIGWFQGRLEFGPRALGGRSILASPVNARMQDRLNEIKDREDFRPVAPVVHGRPGRGTGLTKPMSLLSCCSFLMSWRIKPSAFLLCAMSTVPPAFRPSTASRMSRITTCWLLSKSARVFRCW
jgi:carbamoyltransferase